MELSSIIKLMVGILASFAAGGIGTLFTFKAIPTWYPTLKKPPYTPPNQAFGPVWTTLYILMGVSVYFVWQKWSGQQWCIARFCSVLDPACAQCGVVIYFLRAEVKRWRGNSHHCPLASHPGNNHCVFPGFGLGRRTFNPLHSMGQHRDLPERWHLDAE